jgi:hypothetical protein
MAHLQRIRTGSEASPSSSPSPPPPAGCSPQMPRSASVGSFLDLRDVNIADDTPRVPCDEGGGGALGAAPRDASTPRAAPCIALPKQNAELLRHFAIGAAAFSTRGAARGLPKHASRHAASVLRALRSCADAPPRGPRRHRRLADQACVLFAGRGAAGAWRRAAVRTGGGGRAASLPEGASTLLARPGGVPRRAFAARAHPPRAGGGGSGARGRSWRLGGAPRHQRVPLRRL